MTNRLIHLVMLIGLLSGCATVNHPSNLMQEHESLSHIDHSIPLIGTADNQVTVILAFSGGGTRAAALSYGVLKQLNETEINIDNQPRSLLSEVDVISSVSGGSFTAAYYGLYQDQIFLDYERDFLKQDVKDELISNFLSPSRWFTGWGRTDTANNYYQEQLFGDATLGDISKSDGPYVIINASDITTGVRFSFIQKYFNFLCSDVNDFPVSKAVAASAAVPVLFEPVVLENYAGCEPLKHKSMDSSSKTALSFRSQKTAESIRQYSNKQKNRYVHLVDGGITDNLGLLAIYDLLELGRFHQSMNYLGTQEHHIIVISVDASTEPELGIGQHPDNPSIRQTLNSITDIQLHRYNDATKALFMDSMQRWAHESSTAGLKIIPHFVQIGFQSVEDEKTKVQLNQVPTDLTLEAELVDMIIEEGQVQLEANDFFQKAVKQIQ
ncbi:patatin-like phospholipase family protein [Vibrio maerlii]|uniref:patatin-like phospholipase family protein n=1 Tax=Vibrio maerlii TaxID=2231648 RepID=UPI000E3BB115|nr:patatin-like phospholipase family protein [Vibrio maerlii]